MHVVFLKSEPRTGSSRNGVMHRVRKEPCRRGLHNLSGFRLVCEQDIAIVVEYLCVIHGLVVNAAVRN